MPTPKRRVVLLWAALAVAALLAAFSVGLMLRSDPPPRQTSPSLLTEFNPGNPPGGAAWLGPALSGEALYWRSTAAQGFQVDYLTPMAAAALQAGDRRYLPHISIFTRPGTGPAPAGQPIETKLGPGVITSATSASISLPEQDLTVELIINAEGLPESRLSALLIATVSSLQINLPA